MTGIKPKQKQKIVNKKQHKIEKKLSLSKRRIKLYHHIRDTLSVPSSSEAATLLRVSETTAWRDLEAVKKKVEINPKLLIDEIPMRLKAIMDANYQDSLKAQKVIVAKDKVLTVDDLFLRLQFRKAYREDVAAIVKFLQEIGKLDKIPEKQQVDNKVEVFWCDPKLKDDK